jgi:hypothetical protein
VQALQRDSDNIGFPTDILNTAIIGNYHEKIQSLQTLTLEDKEEKRGRKMPVVCPSWAVLGIYVGAMYPCLSICLPQ